MKSYRLRGFRAPLEAEEKATPSPSNGEVLLRVAAAGVCHSDLHIWEGGYDLGRGKRLMVQDRGVSLPLTMGHETVGIAVALGPEVRGIQLGTPYLVYPWIGCGECAVCHGGQENLCSSPRSLGIYRDGGYADHLLVPHGRYLIDVDGLDPVTAAPLACSGLTTWSAIEKGGTVILQEPIVVFGAGGLGLMSLALLKARGAVGAVVVDIDERKRAAALSAGAIAAVDGTSPDAVDEIVRACGGAPRVAIDFVGTEDTAAAAFRCLAKSGQLITVGLFGGAAPWSLPLIALRAINIQGSYVGNLRQLRELVDTVRRDALSTIPITPMSMDQVNHALSRLQAGAVVGRAVLTP